MWLALERLMTAPYAFDAWARTTVITALTIRTGSFLVFLRPLQLPVRN